MQSAQSNAQQYCVVCNQFFGTPERENMCSSCYNLMKKETTKPEEQKIQEEPIVKPKQEDPSRCKQCNKKIGIYGYQCKCEYFFCTKHRLPEEHSCTYDHAGSAKQKLIQQNPLILPSKIEKI